MSNYSNPFKLLYLIVSLIGLPIITIAQNIINVGIASDTLSLDPVAFGYKTNQPVMPYLFTSLVETDVLTDEKIPMLAETLPTVEQKGHHLCITYKLRNDARWDDGTSVTVDDVIFSFKLLMSQVNRVKKYSYKWIIAIKKDKKDSSRFTIITNSTGPTYEPYISSCYILPENQYDKNKVLRKYSFNQLYSDNEVNREVYLSDYHTKFFYQGYKLDSTYIKGGGAYQIAEWHGGKNITLVKKSNWWGRAHENDACFFKAYPDKINFKVLATSDSSKFEALKRQELDIAGWFVGSFDSFTNGEWVKDFNFYEKDVDAFSFIAINTRLLKLSTVNTRKALAMLVPYDSLINRFSFTRINFPAAAIYEAAKDVSLVTFDVQNAIQLLEKDGWGDTDKDGIREKEINGVREPFNLTLLLTDTNGYTGLMIRYIRECYKKAGINLIVQTRNWNDVTDIAKTTNFDMLYTGWVRPSNLENVINMWHTNARKARWFNFSGFGNGTTDKLIDRINDEMDDHKRNEMAKELFSIVSKEQPVIWMFKGKSYTAVHKKFTETAIRPDKFDYYLGAFKQ